MSSVYTSGDRSRPLQSNHFSIKKAIVFGEKPPACQSIAGLMAIVSTPRAGLCQARSSARRYPRGQLLPTHCRWDVYSRDVRLSVEGVHKSALVARPCSTRPPQWRQPRPTRQVFYSYAPPCTSTRFVFVKQCGKASGGARQNGGPSPACTILVTYMIFEKLCCLGQAATLYWTGVPRWTRTILRSSR